MLLRKTKNFVAAFRHDLRYITIPPYGILFKGSYKLKNIGAVITDIDLNQFVVPDKKFIENLDQICTVRILERGVVMGRVFERDVIKISLRPKVETPASCCTIS